MDLHFDKFAQIPGQRFIKISVLIGNSFVIAGRVVWLWCDLLTLLDKFRWEEKL